MRAIAISISLLLVALPAFSQKDFYETEWSNVYRQEAHGLPQTALKTVNEIYKRAKKDQNISQITKALLYQSKFALQEENAELVILTKWKEEIKQSKAPLRNLLECITANLYWQYFKDNRWTYYNRSRTKEVINVNDFRTWDADALFTEIESHLVRSLANPGVLQSVSLKTLDDILTDAENSNSYRPTLYDFIAHQALDYYSANERYANLPDKEVHLTDPDYFEEIENVVWKGDSLSPIAQALHLFKELMRFHTNDKEPFALVNLHIEWIQFLSDHGKFTNERTLRMKALTRLQSQYQHHPASAQASFELANLLYEEGATYNAKTNTITQFKKREALLFCEEVIKKYPSSEGATKCTLLRDHILNQQLSIETEGFVPIQKAARLRITYTNVKSLTFFAYAITEEFREPFYRKMSDSTRMVELATRQISAQWIVELPTANDYQQHSTETVLPPLDNGMYLLVAREHTDTLHNDLYAFATLQVTNLALLEGDFQNEIRYQIVDRNTGKPLSNADVHFKSSYSSPQSLPIDQRMTTDKNGFVEVQRERKHIERFSATVIHQNDTAVFTSFSVYPRYGEDREDDDQITAKAFVFTDRSIYRPGQTVYYKGILMKTKNKLSSVVGGQYVEVSLDDVNGEEIGFHRIKTNQYGSFSGEFVLPATGVTGEHILYVDEDYEEDSKFYESLDNFEPSQVDISVEEYKRPTFEVNFKSLTSEHKVLDSVKVHGSALAFSGAKVAKAKVQYHVKRTVRYPRWYYWSQRHPSSTEEEITSGETITNDTGEFAITFLALPDLIQAKENLPVFRYEVTADIVDITGETRSASTTVNVGYHSLQATVQVPEKIKQSSLDNMLTVQVENLNGQAVHAVGQVRIYTQKANAYVSRSRPWEEPDLPLLTEEEFHQVFPHDSYTSEDTGGPPAKDKLLLELPFNTTTSKEIKWNVPKSWKPGSYIVELETKDKQGNAVVDWARFAVVDQANNMVLENKLFHAELDKKEYHPGEAAKLTIGSASPDITFTICIEKKQKITKTYVEHLSGNTKDITIPITPDMEEGFSLHISAVNYNACFIDKKNVPVITPHDKLEIETIIFKDKLQPGAKETWSFEIRGNNQPLLEAEVLASMYDASLDQFKPHQWEFTPIQTPRYYSYHDISGNTNFTTPSFEIRNVDSRYYSYPHQYYNQLDWFGFSITGNELVHRHYIERLYSTGLAAGAPSKVTTSLNRSLRKGVISGTIISAEDGSPLPGVNVVVKGTTRGTVTDEGGHYSLEASKNEELVFSFIGLTSAEVKVGGRNIVDVAMTMDITQLSEVVVTAMGVAIERKSLGYSVSTILAEDEDSDLVFHALEAKVAGLQITGIPGGTVNVRIRGASALSDKDQPLYVVDGVIVKSYTLDQNDIGSIQVLKGQAATTLYGAQAANGVILITTKSGQKKKDEEMAKVNARKDFKETAFFFPHLTTNEEGRIRFTFTTPESLTRWKLQLLAHTKEMMASVKTLESVTQKELMVTPNAPRFLRMNDEIIFSTKISNLTAKSKTGTAALQLTNAFTGENVDVLFKNSVRNQPFKVEGKGSTEVSWKLKVPDNLEAVQYKVIAKAGNFSDGEQNVLPVLSNRMLVTETMPMYVRSGQSKTFTLDKLQQIKSTTLKHHQLTLEVSSNPAWYAVQALPYLMEFPHECAEQLFSRYYANALASHIVKSNPNIKAVFESWASSKALLSELEKNQELKNIIIQETPWFRDAQNETEQKKRIALLFDLVLVERQMQDIVPKLQNLQLSSGGFSWFAGGQYPSRYITQHVASGFGHLQQVGVKLSEDAISLQRKAISFLDAEIAQDYTHLVERANSIRVNAKNSQEGNKLAAEYLDAKRPTPIQVQYLYMRSFYPDVAIPESARMAVNYYQQQAATHWMNANLYMKGMVALIHKRLGNTVLPKKILQSLQENSIQSDELGMFWKENKASWYWHESPIETHALLLEAFAEIDYTDAETRQKTLDNLRIWLLKNKQTNQWSTTKATTEAVYALLMTGSSWLSIDNQLEVRVAKKKVEPGNTPEGGIGYYKTSWKGEAITPAMSEVTLTSTDKTITWAGLYWQYFEDLDKITTAETPLKVSKKVFIVKRDEKGEILTEVNPSEPVEVGSLLRIRMELKIDRPMEFLHLKDMRAAGLEPVDVLSGYKVQEKLWYYQSTKDASTNFFFDEVESGVYVFEYDLRAVNKGDFSNGITTIQCMYAPEFSSHSEGIRISIK